MRGNVLQADDFDVTQTNLGHSTGQLFDCEEMQAIREQYEERLVVEQEKREELEWQVRMALASIRDAELDARRAADQMRKVHGVLQGLLGVDQALQPTLGSAQGPRVAAPKPGAKVSPPPIPPSAKRASGPLPPRNLTGYKRLVA